MTAKAATVRLYVAAVGLLTAVLSLLGALVLLGSSAAAWLAARLQVRAEASRERPAPRVATPPPRRLAVVPRPVAGPAQGASAARLTVALTGMGFRAPDVRRFVGSLGERVEHEPIEGLIKDGLRSLAVAS